MNYLFNEIGKPIVVASHPRSGTHLTIDLLRKQFSLCSTSKSLGESFDHLYLELESLSVQPLDPTSEIKALKILKKAQRPIIKTHSDPNFSHLTSKFDHWQAWLKNESTPLYVLRDGRSVMCSLHLFMQGYDPKTRCSLSDFLRQTINGQSRVKRWANHVNTWLAQPGIHFIKFEDIITNTLPSLIEISQILDLEPLKIKPLLPKSIRGLWHGRWVRLTETRPESSAIIGYYKGQKSVKWKTAFSLSDREFFHAEAGELLQRLGYIHSDDWINH